MLRFRHLYKKQNRFQLVSKFVAKVDEVLDNGSPLECACLITFDFTRNSDCINVQRFRKDPNNFYPLPSLDQIQGEVGYMFQLFNSLSPYETSLPPSQKSQDIPPVSA